jgi:hypothetical protein
MSVSKRPMFHRFAIVLLALALISLFITSCDGMSRTGSVKATALLSGKVLELPMRNTADWGGYNAWGGLTFKSRTSMRELSPELTDHGGSLYPANDSSSHVMLFHTSNDNGTSDDYCIRLISADGTNSTYIFSGMEAKVTTEQDAFFSMLLPIHLISDERINKSIVAEINLGAEYETLEYSGEKIEVQNVLNVFYSFYEDSGWYNLEKGDDYFLIKGYKPDASIRSEKALDLPSPIKVSFVKHVNVVYFVVSFEEL